MMKVEVVGKNGFVPSVANKEYAILKLKKIESFLGLETELNALVVCKVYREFHKVEVTIPTKNLIMRAEVSDIDLYAAIDQSIDKLMGQLRKHKTKTKSKIGKEGMKDVAEQFDAESLEKEIFAERIVRNKEIELTPMTQDEAMSQMELLGHDFFIFKDKATHKVSVMYLRNDGNYAVIETK